MRVNNLSKVVT